MKATIKINGKTYSDFNEIQYINEADSFPIYVTLLDNNYEYKNLTGKTVTATLEFFEVKDNTNKFILTGTVETAASGFLKFEVDDEFVGKGYTIYKVFMRLVNTTDSENYNVFLGKLIITADEENFGEVA
jgi:hypothetical protein